jgi:DNA invertase Pin-like site-specific DNA recombinase
VKTKVQKKTRELNEEQKKAIRKRIDKGERNSTKLAKESGVGRQQVAGIMARHLHPESWT